MVGILIVVLELLYCLVATPHGLAFNSSGEKIRADEDGRVDNATMAAMIVARRRFILILMCSIGRRGSVIYCCVDFVCLEMCLFDL